MKSEIKNMFVSSLISSCVMLVMGLILFINPESTIALISYIFGGILVIVGANALINYYMRKQQISTFELIYGVLGIVGGLILILNPRAIASLIPLVLGIWITISSLGKLKYIWDNAMKDRKGTISLVITIIMLILGILLIFKPFDGAKMIAQMVGLFLVIYSILDIVQSFMIKNTVESIVVEIEPKKRGRKKKVIDEK